MKIHVDYDRCEGHGLCAAQAPGIFRLDDDGELIDRSEGEDIAPDQVAAVRSAIGSCPVAALREIS